MPIVDSAPLDASAERLAVVYAQAERELRKVVRDAAARGADGTAAYYERQRRKVAARLAQLRAANRALAGPAVERAYMASAEAAAAVLERAFEFAGPNEAAIRALGDALEGRLEAGVTTVGRSMDDVLRRVSLGEVEAGLARADTRRGISARIRAKLADEGVTAFRDAAGRRWRMEVYASMVARTTTREASTRGTIDGIRQAGGDLTTVSTHSTSCDICRQFEGKTYSISGRDGRYPRLERAAPFHPNCRHVMTPAAVSFEDFERELGLA